MPARAPAPVKSPITHATWQRQPVFASWTKLIGTRPPKYQGVLRSDKSKQWLWQCEHRHESRREAVACALFEANG
jgi:hypothetical protein